MKKNDEKPPIGPPSIRDNLSSNTLTIIYILVAIFIVLVIIGNSNKENNSPLENVSPLERAERYNTNFEDK